MPRPYQPPNISSPETLITYANEVTNKMLGVGFLSIFAIMVFSFCKIRFMRNSDSAAVSLTLTTIVGLFVWVMGWITGDKAVMFIILAVAAILWSFLDRE